MRLSFLGGLHVYLITVFFWRSLHVHFSALGLELLFSCRYHHSCILSWYGFG